MIRAIWRHCVTKKCGACYQTEILRSSSTSTEQALTATLRSKQSSWTLLPPPNFNIYYHESTFCKVLIYVFRFQNLLCMCLALPGLFWFNFWWRHAKNCARGRCQPYSSRHWVRELSSCQQSLRTQCPSPGCHRSLDMFWAGNYYWIQKP